MNESTPSVEDDMPTGWKRREIDGRESWFYHGHRQKWHVIAIGNEYALSYIPAESFCHGALLVKDWEIVSFNNAAAAAWYACHMYLDDLRPDILAEHYRRTAELKRIEK